MQVFLKRDSGRVLITMPKQLKRGYSPSLLKFLLEGILTGLLQTFRLVNPKIVEETDSAIVWEIGHSTLF